MAFAAGCTACFAFLATIGKLLGKGKDNEIALLKGEVAVAETRYDKMTTAWKQTFDDERDRCERMETRLVARIQNLEGIILMSTPAYLRPPVRTAIETSSQEYQEGANDEADR